MAKKLKACKHCGKDVAKKAKTCPSCGGKLRMHWFLKNCILWAVLIGLVIGLLTGLPPV